MKNFVLLKLPLLLLLIGAALVLTPACKAQSEVSPDHFDGTDFWARTGQKIHASVPKQQAAKASLQEKSQKANQSSTLQLTSARDAKPANGEAVAADRKRKAAAGTPEKQ